MASLDGLKRLKGMVTVRQREGDTSSSYDYNAISTALRGGRDWPDIDPIFIAYRSHPNETNLQGVNSALDDAFGKDVVKFVSNAHESSSNSRFSYFEIDSKALAASLENTERSVR